MYLELLPTFTWYGTSISPTVIVPNAPTYRLYLTMKYINSPLAELFHFKVACKFPEARVKRLLLYIRRHLHLSISAREEHRLDLTVQLLDECVRSLSLLSLK